MFYNFILFQVAFDFSDRYVLAASPRGKVFVWDLISEKIHGICRPNESTVQPVTSISSHPQRSSVAAGMGGGVYFFDLEGEWAEKEGGVGGLQPMMEIP